MFLIYFFQKVSNQQQDVDLLRLITTPLITAALSTGTTLSTTVGSVGFGGSGGSGGGLTLLAALSVIAALLLVCRLSFTLS